MKKGSGDEVRVGEEDFFLNPYAKLDEVIEKKRRNLEKRKIRLLQYEDDDRNGKKLSEEQVQALSRIGEVETQIEFVKEILKTLTALHKDFNRAKKQREETVKREQMERERKSLADFVRYQNLLKSFGKEHVKKAFVDGSDGAVKLDETDCSALEFLNDCFNPAVEESMSNGDWESKCGKSAAQVHAVLHGTKEKLLEKRTGGNMKELLEKVAACDYVKEMVANQLNTEEEVVEDTKSDASEEALQKEDPKVVFVQGEGEVSKEPSESDTAEATTTEFGYEGYGNQENNPNENASNIESAPKTEETGLATGDTPEFPATDAPQNAPAPWAPASNSEVKPDEAVQKPAEGNENVFVEGTVSSRPERRPRGGFRGGNRYRDNLTRDGNERRRVPKDGRQVRNFDNGYGTRGSVRGGRGPGRGGYQSRGGGNRSQNSHMNDLTNGYGNGGNYTKSYNDANPPRRIGINFASDVDSHK